MIYGVLYSLTPIFSCMKFNVSLDMSVNGPRLSLKPSTERATSHRDKGFNWCGMNNCIRQKFKVV